ncbi:alpha/beta hydrolase [Rhodococcus spelaei]|uniref:Alpha/beta hydrolase n=1 Tax=Rhodococcus spelaei TaxID=2546320 RepID=A0A541B3X2_9NOCA|nr:alpha/beta hydrolase [Rhodococcus spelaei]TQF67004.1 alpha/beta hydrolase [Rhodococcus spelaei]
MSNTVTPGRRVTVLADDGVPLAVREFGSPDAPVTAVFVHGHCLRSESWYLLRAFLDRACGPDVRMVFYDHRGHGESGHAAPSTYTIDQLGRDLDAVLAAVVPSGPVVLVGHSMGGMTALAYARQNPSLVGSRLAGIALISTAANGLAEAGLGRLLRSPALSLFHAAVRWAPRVTAGSKRASCRLCTGVVRVAGTGNRNLDPRVVALAAAMVNDTSVVTMSSFLKSFAEFDESGSVPALAGIPAVVVCGSADLMTPFAHSAALAARLPGAELVRIEGAGHSVILERAQEVAVAIGALLVRAAGDGAAPAPAMRLATAG